jgi:DNA-binding NarL/FixJ family response regulator
MFSPYFYCMKIKNNIKTIVVDGSALFRKALAEMLSSKGINIIGEADNEKAMFEQLAAQTPDILIYDFFNSSERFDQTMGKIRKAAPKIKVVVLSFDSGTELIDFCLAHGVSGFCDKNITNFDYLADGLKKIGNGGTVILTNQPVNVLH